MFREDSYRQITLDNRMLSAGKQSAAALERSRAKLVGDVIYPNVDEHKFAPLFSEKGSRPNISIRRYVSALVLKRMYAFSDADLLEFLRCGALNLQYALHTEQESEQPLSESSLRRFRSAVLRYNKENRCDLIKEEFERISKGMAVSMGLLHDDPNDGDSEADPVIVRMDSMEIEAHAKVMTRLEILYTANMIMVRYLLKKDFNGILPPELGHYLEDGDHNQVLYYRVPDEEKATVQKTRVETAVREMVLMDEALKKNFSEDVLGTIPEYHVFRRVLSDQTVTMPDGTVMPKDKHDISAGSIQNPFDATVTYRNKRGPHHGSVLNLAEVHDKKGNGIIVHASVEPNTASDMSMARSYVESQPDGGPAQEVIVDGAYAGEELEKLAAEKNITIQVTSLTGKLPDEIFADFELDEEQEVILSCPAKHAPTKCSFNENTGKITALMPDNCCASCPNREKCKAKVNNKKSRSQVSVYVKNVNTAKKARQIKSKEYKEIANSRNGVEGIMSVMRRKYGLDEIPVFGLERSGIWIWTSLLAYNLVKLKKYLSPKKPQAAI